MALPNNVFTGYSPTQLRKLAQSYGYNESNLDNFGKFLEENPSRAKQYFDQQNMDMFGPDKMRQFQQGGTTTEGPQIPKIAELTAQRVTQPQLPVGGVFQAVGTPLQQAQLIDPTVGQVTAVQIPQATQVDPAVVAAPTKAAVPTVTAAAAAPAIQALPGTAQALEAPTQTVEAAQQAQSQLANLQLHKPLKRHRCKRLLLEHYKQGNKLLCLQVKQHRLQHL